MSYPESSRTRKSSLNFCMLTIVIPDLLSYSWNQRLVHLLFALCEHQVHAKKTHLVPEWAGQCDHQWNRNAESLLFLQNSQWDNGCWNMRKQFCPNLVYAKSRRVFCQLQEFFRWLWCVWQRVVGNAWCAFQVWLHLYPRPDGRHKRCRNVVN